METLKFEGNTRISTRLAQIWIEEENIIHVCAQPDAHIDLQETVACFTVYKHLLNGKKGLQLIDAKGNFTISKDSRDYVAKHGSEYFLASAVVSDNLAIRLIVNFFNSFYKSEVPFRMFTSEEEALKWLKKFKKA